MSTLEPIAIVGIGLRLPGADDPEELWTLLEQRRDVTREIPNERFSKEFWCSDTKIKGSSISHRGSFVDNIGEFDAPFFNLSPNEARELDPQIRLILEASWYAIEDAGFVLSSSSKDGGVFMGHMTEDYMNILNLNRYTINSHAMQGNAPTMAANRLSYFLDLHGPSEVIDTACSSSLVAVHHAVSAIRNGECSWALAGGSNALLDPRYFVGFTDWGTMSKDGHCFSFDARGNGYVRAEGCAVLLLKKLKDAEASCDRIYCVIRHSGVNHDGNKPAITVPSSIGQSELMMKLYKESDIDPNSIGYIEAHGTGTVAGDKVELNAIGNTLCSSNRKTTLLVGSIKSNFGHLEGAAGVAGLIKTALCIYKGKVLPNIKFNTPNKEVDFDRLQLRVPTILEDWPSVYSIRRGSINSFGIGGTNAHVILEEYVDRRVNIMNTGRKLWKTISNEVNIGDLEREAEAPALDEGDVVTIMKTHEAIQIQGNSNLTTEFINDAITTTDINTIFTVVWSTKSEKLLKVYAQKLYDQWTTMKDSERESFCYTLALRRNMLSHRAAALGTKDEISTSLYNYIHNTDATSVVTSCALDKEYRSLVFVFCGQGAQWKEMGIDLSTRFPVYKQSLLSCQKAIESIAGWNLLEKICSDDVNNTFVSQPATTAVQIALVDLLASFNIHPCAVIGHSSGEIAAAYAAGAVTLEEAMKIAYYRGEFINDLCPTDGGMLVVGMKASEVKKYIDQYTTICIACYNAESTLTLSGKKDELAMLERQLKQDNYFCRMLKVSHAFHSPQMDPAMPKYEEALRSIKPKSKLKCEFFSSCKNNLIEDGSILNSKYFVENLTHPVLFYQTLEKIDQKHIDQPIYLEIGPHPTLNKPILQTLSKKENLHDRVFGTLNRAMPDILAIKETINRLFVTGAYVNQAFLATFIPCYPYTKLPLYPFDRKFLWFESEDSYRNRQPVLVHPWLGVEQINPLPTWERIIDIESQPWIYDHIIAGSLLAPGALYIDIALAAGTQVYKTDHLCITDSQFLQAMILPKDGHIRIRTTCDPETGEVNIYHRDPPSENSKCFTENEEKRWTLHYKGFVSEQTENYMIKEGNQLLHEAYQRCSIPVDIDGMYERMRIQGLEFGPGFQSLQKARIGVDEGICVVRPTVPGIYQDTSKGHILHPILIDALFQSMICILGEKEGGCIPICITSFNMNKSNQPLHKRSDSQSDGEDRNKIDEHELTIYVKKSKTKHNINISADIWMYYNDEPFIWTSGCQVVPLHRDTHVDLNILSTIKYMKVGHTEPFDVSLIPSSIKYILLRMSIHGALNESVLSNLKHSIISYGLEDINRLDMTLPIETFNSVHGILLLVDSDPKHPRVVKDLFSWIKVIMNWTRQHNHLPPVFIVTQGSTIEVSNTSCSNILGLYRVFDSENPSVQSLYLDIDMDCSRESIASSIFDIITRKDITQYHELSIRKTSLYTPRVLPIPSPPLPHYPNVPSQNYKIEQAHSGVLDTFIRTEGDCSELQDDEVYFKVFSVGLNYKDVLVSLGVLKEDAFIGGKTSINFGLEASGVALQVGSKVTRIKPGDHIYGLLDNGIQLYSKAKDYYLFKIPPSVSFNQAVALYTAYTTAYATILNIGKVKRNDIVLIHGAAGGVGSAAVQLAKSRGAIVIGSVSNREKAEYIKSLGAHYTVNSRNTSFVEDVLAITKGRGCDVILNCLSSHSMYMSQKLLAPFGRFIEIGKTDAMNRKSINIHNFLNNGTYSFFDLDRYFVKKDCFIPWVEGVIEEIEAGNLIPPPTTVYPLYRISDALRCLSASKHIGKIAIQLTNEDGQELETNQLLPFVPKQYLNDHSVYLIIGGTRGIGLRICEWLSEHGGRHFILLSRSGLIPNCEKLPYDRMIQNGIHIDLVSCDVTSTKQVRDQLNYILTTTRDQLKGVIYCAMILHDSLLSNMTYEQFEEGSYVKVKGAWNIHNYTIANHIDLDFFICLSSISTIVGNPGQSNYCSGNSYLEGLMRWRTEHNMPGYVLNLGAVMDAGAVSRNKQIVNKELQNDMISINQVLGGIELILQRVKYNVMVNEKMNGLENNDDEYLNELLKKNKHMNGKKNEKNVIYDTVESPKNEEQHEESDSLPIQLVLYPFNENTSSQLKNKTIFSEIYDKSQNQMYNPSNKKDHLLKETLLLSSEERLEVISRNIKETLASLLGTDSDSFRLDQSLTTLGIDSIVAVELKNIIDSTWNMNLPIFELTSGKTIMELVLGIQSHLDELIASHGSEEAQTQEKNTSEQKRISLSVNLLESVEKEHVFYTVEEMRNCPSISEEEREVIERSITMNLYADENEVIENAAHEEPDSASSTKLDISNSNPLEVAVLKEINATSINFKDTRPSETYKWENTREYFEMKTYLKSLPWNPYYFTQDKKTATVSDIEGFSDCINYTTYDYLGLSTSEEVRKESQIAINKYGTSVSASRLAGGQIPIHNQLEREIADFLGVEDCIVMLGGHTANVNCIRTLMSKRDLILYDSLSHNSIIEGASYSGATKYAFKHNDMKDLEQKLNRFRSSFEKVLITIEGVYSMDGDLPDLPAFIKLKQRFNCILYVDEAHSIGVLGETGRGIGEHFHVDRKFVDIWMGSLGKAFASAGGYLAGSRKMVQILRYRAPGFVYSIGLPPANAAAALGAIRVARKEEWRISRLRYNTDLFKRLCQENHLDIYQCTTCESAVIPVHCGATERCIEAMRLLRERGVLVSAGMYPAVEAGKARLRFFVSASHTEEEIRKTVSTITDVLSEI